MLFSQSVPPSPFLAPSHESVLYICVSIPALLIHIFTKSWSLGLGWPLLALVCLLEKSYSLLKAPFWYPFLCKTFVNPSSSQVRIPQVLLNFYILYRALLVFPASSDSEEFPARQESRVWSLGQEVPLEVATHSSILAWRILWTEEPGGLQSIGSLRVRHSWMTNTFHFFYHFYHLCYYFLH